MRWAGCLIAAVMGAGCAYGDDVTEVRMVVESHIEARGPLDTLRVSQLERVGAITVDAPARFPYLVAITPNSQLHPFALNVQLRPDEGSQLIIISRNVRDVPFVATERRMFVMPLQARCECQGTSCPDPGDPDCDDLRAPTLVPLDERAIRWPDLAIDLSAGGMF